MLRLPDCCNVLLWNYFRRFCTARTIRPNAAVMCLIFIVLFDDYGDKAFCWKCEGKRTFSRLESF